MIQPFPRLPRLPRRGRRALLVVHVTASVGWLGLTAGVLALGLAGRYSTDQDTARAAYLALDVIAGTMLLPTALLALLSGLWLGLGTPWGLVRHWWVLVKLVLTAVATAATALALLPTVNAAASAVASDGVPAAGDALSLVAAPCVSLSLYLFMTAVSVLKPWGLTPRGVRQRRLGRAGGPPGAAARPPVPAGKADAGPGRREAGGIR